MPRFGTWGMEMRRRASAGRRFPCAFDPPAHSRRRRFVAADEHIYRAGAVAHRADAVAGAVDLHHQAVLGDGVGGTDVQRRVHGFAQQRRAFGLRHFPMPEHLVAVCTKQRFKPHLFGGHAAAEADGFPGRHIREQITAASFAVSKIAASNPRRRSAAAVFFQFFHGINPSLLLG